MLDSNMGESSKFLKSWTLEIQIFKPTNIYNFMFEWLIVFWYLKINQKRYYNLPNSAFWGWLLLSILLLFRNI